MSKARQRVDGTTHDSGEPTSRGPDGARRPGPESRDGGAVQEHVSSQKEGEGAPEVRKVGGPDRRRLHPLDRDSAARERLGSPSRSSRGDEPNIVESSRVQGQDGPYGQRQTPDHDLRPRICPQHDGTLDLPQMRSPVPSCLTAHQSCVLQTCAAYQSRPGGTASAPSPEVWEHLLHSGPCLGLASPAHPVVDLPERSIAGSGQRKPDCPGSPAASERRRASPHDPLDRAVAHQAVDGEAALVHPDPRPHAMQALAAPAVNRMSWPVAAKTNTTQAR